MAIPVIDFSKVNGTGEERARTMAQIANGCEEWGFFQLMNHGIPEELLEKVKKVCSEYFKLEREEIFKNSAVANTLKALAEKNSGEKLENVDWEDVITLLDDNEWPSKTPGFKETMTEYRAELKKLAEKIEVLSNGRYKSTWHRVLATPDGNRRSIASFYNPSLKATIAPAPELVEKDNEEINQTYPKFLFGDYMSVYAEQKFLPKEPRFQSVRAV
ncbi:1-AMINOCYCLOPROPANE-1-CARBOXYLATE OXIDASE 5-LIKE [Salix purpurea]|uniref:1-AMINOCYCLOPROPANE-1-CARBOXYLATE OXIDASE 5-LIKE n=1 Tax=Salix purpurea TaxID=77065 RepID=A0A9Q0SPW2_SALPP|nr:1-AMINOCYCLOPROPANE-1-CARBOXYLATE OXIDASE 5-LIKE [Salix purpurea]